MVGFLAKQTPILITIAIGKQIITWVARRSVSDRVVVVGWRSQNHERRGLDVGDLTVGVERGLEIMASHCWWLVRGFELKGRFANRRRKEHGGGLSSDPIN
ncbi:hypothetical protein OIU77_026085 [Salix suchowensis]|uniref:Uncharacterized protein n=1 Tax=Salix suchowensis TaxID=1278906 RepID=A0ABQ9BYH8_9ROSI|nr:hypothetical protein OIU77_026085 [Salix suchowensis]